MLKIVEEYIKKNKMIEPGELVVVGVSGGADSVCLLDMLSKLAPKLDFSLCAVHVNHMIRGEEADRDQQYVEELCEKYGVSLITKRIDVPALSKENGESLEEAGRKARYEAFFGVEGVDKIAVAHHKDDQAETVLYNIVRGSSVKGAGGMRPVRDNIIRPLLCLGRGQIEAYLSENNIAFCTDSTNLCSDYTRNKLRNQVIPMLEESINADAVGNINDFANDLSECYDFIKSSADTIYSEAVRKGTCGELLINVAMTVQSPGILRREVIVRALGELAGGVKDITRRHINAVDSLFLNEVSKKVVLPYGLLAVRDYEEVRICRGNVVAEVPVKPEIVLTIRDFDGNWQKLTNDYTKVFDYDKIEGNVILRTRMPGDYIVLDDKGHKKSLKKFFIDEKIPERIRDSVWLVAEGSNILWIIGYRVSASCRTCDSTKRILEIALRRNCDDGI